MSPRWAGRAWKGALLVALLALTWILLTPAPPETPGAALPLFDKLQHAIAFALLALLAAKAYPDKPRWGVAAALVFYGLSIEIAQPRSGREFEILDVVADALGSLAVYLAPRVRTRRDP